MENCEECSSCVEAQLQGCGSFERANNPLYQCLSPKPIPIYKRNKILRLYNLMKGEENVLFQDTMTERMAAAVLRKRNKEELKVNNPLPPLPVVYTYHKVTAKNL
jgi:hypothetical protein